MGRKRIDHTDRSGGVGSAAIWNAACSCGKVLEVVAKDVAAGKKSTCGRCRGGLGIPGPEFIRATGVPKGQMRAFRALVRAAGGLEGAMEFSTTDYCNHMRNRCLACNTRSVHVEWSDLRGTATPDNMVAICDACSRLRKGMNMVKWLEHIVRIARNIMLRTNNTDT